MIHPIIWQERENYEFTAKIRPDNDHVFTNDCYLYGVRARVNAGSGLCAIDPHLRGGRATSHRRMAKRIRRYGIDLRPTWDHARASCLSRGSP